MTENDKRCYWQPQGGARTRYATNCGHEFVPPDADNDWYYEPGRPVGKPPIWKWCQYCGKRLSLLGIIPTVAATKPGGCAS